MLIAKTLRSSTFRVALICIAGFGAIVVTMFLSVYWSTATYVLNRSDWAIDRDRGVLLAAFRIKQTCLEQAHRAGLRISSLRWTTPRGSNWQHEPGGDAH